MSSRRVFITGSADGLGRNAAALLVAQGHRVVLHARNAVRAAHAIASTPGADGVVTGDLATFAGMGSVAEQANALGPFHAVIHNAAVGYREPAPVTTADGLPHVLAINSIAPYVLTARMARPARLVYLSSGLHRSGDASLEDLKWTKRRWNGMQAYADSKLHDLLLAFAVARRWRDVRANALEPGWVATKMGGPGAPDDLALGAVTQAWLATSTDAAACVTGGYFFHQRRKPVLDAATDASVQDRFIAACERLTGIPLPP